MKEKKEEMRINRENKRVPFLPCAFLAPAVLACAALAIGI